MLNLVGMIAGVAVLVFGLYFLIRAFFSETGAAGVMNRQQTLWGFGLIVLGILIASAFVIVGFRDVIKLSDAQVVRWAEGIYNDIFSGSLPNLLK